MPGEENKKMKLIILLSVLLFSGCRFTEERVSTPSLKAGDCFFPNFQYESQSTGVSGTRKGNETFVTKIIRVDIKNKKYHKNDFWKSSQDSKYHKMPGVLRFEKVEQTYEVVPCPKDINNL